MYFGEFILTRANLNNKVALHKFISDTSSRISLIDILENNSKSLTFYQKIRYFLKLIKVSCFKKYQLKISDNKASSFYYIQTDRKDAKSRFFKIIDKEFKKFKPIQVKTVNNSIIKKIINLFNLTKILFYQNKSHNFLNRFIISSNSLLSSNFEINFSKNIKVILFYSEHEKFSRVMLEKLSKTNIQFKTYLHGFPFFPRDLKSYSPSNYAYLFSYVSCYYVWNDLSRDRLLKIFGKILISKKKPMIKIKKYNPYSDDIAVVSQKKKVRLVVCLSNHRWSGANNEILKIANYISSKLEMSLIVRPHPSLSKSHLKQVYPNIRFNDQEYYFLEDIHLIYHSTLYFSLTHLNCTVFRFVDKFFDDFGDASLCFHNEKSLLKLIEENMHAK